MIVVLDTNVWISALEFGGTPDSAVFRAITQDQLAISSFIKDEIARVLIAQLNELLVHALWVEVAGKVRGVCRDNNDDAILETAWKADADYLVAGDKDLLSLGTFRKTTIISPAAYLQLR